MGLERNMEGGVVERVYQENIESLASSMRGEIEEGKTPFAKFYQERALDKIPTTHGLFKTFFAEMLRQFPEIEKAGSLEEEVNLAKYQKNPDLVVLAKGTEEPLLLTLKPEKIEDLNYSVKEKAFVYGGKSVDSLEVGINPELWVEAIATFRSKINRNPEEIPSFAETRDQVIEGGDFGKNFMATEPEKVIRAIEKH